MVRRDRHVRCEHQLQIGSGRGERLKKKIGKILFFTCVFTIISRSPKRRPTVIIRTRETRSFRRIFDLYNVQQIMFVSRTNNNE